MPFPTPGDLPDPGITASLSCVSAFRSEQLQQLPGGGVKVVAVDPRVAEIRQRPLLLRLLQAHAQLEFYFNSAETLGSKSEMERNPEVPISTQDEALFIPAAMCEQSQGAPPNAKGDLTSLRRHEWILQVDT